MCSGVYTWHRLSCDDAAKIQELVHDAPANIKEQHRCGDVQQMSRMYRVHLEEFDGEEVFAGSTVHQVLKH